MKTTDPQKTSPTTHYDRGLARQRVIHRTMLASDWWISRLLERDVQEVASAFAGGVLIDIGCGGCPYADIFAPYVERYVGLDIPQSDNSTPHVHGVLQALPFASSCADTVFCMQVIEHVPQPWPCLEEMVRILKPSGYLILGAPQVWLLHEAPYDFYRYTEYGLRHMCESAGLEVVQVMRQGRGWSTLALCLFHQAASTVLGLSQAGNKLFRSVRQRAHERSSRPSVAGVIAGIPFLLLNSVLRALDVLPDAGVFAASHLVVARKPAG